MYKKSIFKLPRSIYKYELFFKYAEKKHYYEIKNIEIKKKFSFGSLFKFFANIYELMLNRIIF